MPLGAAANAFCYEGRCAAASKIPVSHAGKLYNVLARRICTELVERILQIAAAQCLLVNRIGEPITDPAALNLKIATRDGFLDDRLRHSSEDIAVDQLCNVASIVEDFIDGSIEPF